MIRARTALVLAAWCALWLAAGAPAAAQTTGRSDSQSRDDCARRERWPAEDGREVGRGNLGKRAWWVA